MLRQFGWFYYLLGFGRTLDHVHIGDVSVERIRRARTEGPVVYVLPDRSSIDQLTLNAILRRRRLPLSVWSDGVRSFYWQPVFEAWGDLLWRAKRYLTHGPPPDPITSGWLTSTVAADDPVTLFVDWQSREEKNVDVKPMQCLVDAQKQTTRPIQVLPVVVVWHRMPEQASDPLQAFLRASRPVTGFFSGLMKAWGRSQGAFVLVGEPLDLPSIVRRVPEGRQARALHRMLWKAVHAEDATVRGPRLLQYKDLKRITLSNPPMRKFAQTYADETGTEYAAVRRKMSRDYDRIAARFQYNVVRALGVILRPLWTKVYSGVDVSDEDLERIREASRRGTAILIPCHKSHLDYVLLSWLMLHHGLIIPHVVAGMNMAIWPLSAVFRRAGAFFVKRRIKGEPLFGTVFKRYVRELVIHGYPVEFFIEGGRTRSGKLLTPRTGVLDMVLEAATYRSTGMEVTLLPISFAYEQIAEEKAYARELGGEEKRPESLREIVKARSVLRRRFGKVYLRVGEGIPCSDIVDASDAQDAWADRDTEERQADLYKVGERIVHGIGSVMVVLPTSVIALALLSHHRRGIRQRHLLPRAHRMLSLLKQQGAPMSHSLAQPDSAFSEALDRFLRNNLIETFPQGGDRIWATVVDKRITLEFYKNQILHYLSAPGLCALTIRALDKGMFTEDELTETFASIAHCYRFEFIMDPMQSREQHLKAGLEALVHYGALGVDEGHYAIRDTERIGEMYSLMRTFAESYRSVLQFCETIDPSVKSLKEIPAAIQKQRADLIATGAITRPEALSLVTLQNAVRAFSQDGVLEQHDARVIVDIGRQAAHLEAVEATLR